jgi:hypothetical protein
MPLPLRGVLPAKASAELGHGGALDARVHALGGSSVTIQSHSLVLGQALGIYLDVLLLRVLAGLRKLAKLAAGHAVHSACKGVLVYRAYVEGI